ncbi:MAG: hypothetical protein ACOYLS_01035 [Polymorphobacter sp.]|jgi:hypothetical protein
MTLNELQANLRAILAAEEQPHIDWAMVEAMCLETIDRLNTEEPPAYPHDVVYHFLDDADIRQNDVRYATVQRKRIMTWLAAPNS